MIQCLHLLCGTYSWSLTISASVTKGADFYIKTYNRNLTHSDVFHASLLIFDGLCYLNLLWSAVMDGSKLSMCLKMYFTEKAFEFYQSTLLSVNS